MPQILEICLTIVYDSFHEGLAQFIHRDLIVPIIKEIIVELLKPLGKCFFHFLFLLFLGAMFVAGDLIE